MLCLAILANAQSTEVQTVAEFKGQQLTGITVTKEGTIFINFPRWREGVEHAVAKLDENGNAQPFPNTSWNSWEIGQEPAPEAFVAVQSVVAYDDKLYVLDTRNPQFNGVLDAPRIFVFDHNSGELITTYLLYQRSYYPNSYINDLRIDEERGFVYMTDSNEPGLVVLNLENRDNRRVLDHHESTTAEQGFLLIDGQRWENTVHTDGIALSPDRKELYFHTLTGYKLHKVSTDLLITGTPADIRQGVQLVEKTAAPDGMIFDQQGNLYYADLENQKVLYRTPEGAVETLVEGAAVKWADTFSIYGGFLYYTNSRINEVATGNLSEMIFSVKKVKLP